MSPVNGPSPAERCRLRRGCAAATPAPLASQFQRGLHDRGDARPEELLAIQLIETHDGNGGHLVAATSVHFDKRVYKRVDAADDQSCRPDFAVALYPGHLAFKRGTLELNPDIAEHISARTPPTFLLQNENDHVDSIWDSLSYEAALIKAKVPVEFHSYAVGGHAFGLRPTASPATHWPQLVEVWLHTIGMLSD